MAGTSVLKLKVDDKEYNSSLKQAQQGMQHLEQALKDAGKSFKQVDKSVVDYVRGIGQMEAQSKTARGRISEMSSAFIELSLQYKNMSNEVKSSDVGKALAESMQQLKQRTVDAKEELDELNKSLNNINTQGAGGGLFSDLGDKMGGALQVFAGNMLTKAAGAVANLGSEMYGMVQQGVEMAKAGEGIRIAFERLGRGDILDGLREATHGTVTDLELMKAAVKFNDFKLPLDELGTMLAFAQQKAKDTGQSVDFLVESIVNGLGRKSLMILDNLGLSATEVKERMAETGDMTKAVGAIIREQMSKAGDYVETAADRAAQANVNLQNKMEELGRKFAPVEEASSQLWTSMKIGILDIIGGPLATLLNQLTEAGRLKNMLNSMNGESGSGNTKVDQQLKKLNVIKKAGGSDYIFNSTLNGMLEDYNRHIMDLDAQIKNGGKRPGAGSGESQDVRYLQQKMDALKVMRDQLAAGAKEINKPIKIESNIPNVTGGGSGKGGSTTTHKATPQETAANKIKEAERIYSETLLKNSIRLEAGMDTTLEYKKRELSAQERLFDAYNDAYATYQDPAYKKASTEAAEKIRALAGEVKAASDAQEAARKSARELDAAQRKLADAQQKLAEARATGSATAVYKAQQEVDKQHQEVDKRQKVVEQVQYVADVKAGKMPTLPENMKAEMVVTANTDEAVRALQAIQGIKIDSKSFTVSTDDADAMAKVSEIDGVTIGPKTFTVTADDEDVLAKLREILDKLSEIQGVSIDTKTFTISTDNEEAMAKIREIQDLTIDQKTVKIVQDVSETGEKSSFDNLVETVQAEIKFDQMKVDETALHTLLQTALQNGLDGLALSYEGIQEKIAKGIDIPDSSWEELYDEINEKLKDLGIEPIKIPIETTKKDVKAIAEAARMTADVVGSIGDAFNAIEDPAAKVMGTVMQAIASVALGYAQATVAASQTGNPWVWLAFAAAGLATMITTISTIHSQTGYAEGGMIKGNSYSGDRIGGLVDGSQLVGLNAGEVVLNAAQQNTLAQNLEGAGLQNLRLEGVISGEKIHIVHNRYLKRSGQGELVTW